MLKRMQTEVEREVKLLKRPHERGELCRSHASVADREAFICSTAAAVMTDCGESVPLPRVRSALWRQGHCAILI